MTHIKQRVRKLETQGGGISNIAEMLEKAFSDHDALLQRLNTMTESALIELAFDDQVGSEERQDALKRLIETGLEMPRAIAALDELERDEVAQLREHAESSYGHVRRGLFQLASAYERGYFTGN